MASKNYMVLEATEGGDLRETHLAGSLLIQAWLDLQKLVELNQFDPDCPKPKAQALISQNTKPRQFRSSDRICWLHPQIAVGVVRQRLERSSVWALWVVEGFEGATSLGLALHSNQNEDGKPLPRPATTLSGPPRYPSQPTTHNANPRPRPHASNLSPKTVLLEPAEGTASL